MNQSLRRTHKRVTNPTLVPAAHTRANLVKAALSSTPNAKSAGSTACEMGKGNPTTPHTWAAKFEEQLPTTLRTRNGRDTTDGDNSSAIPPENFGINIPVVQTQKVDVSILLTRPPTRAPEAKNFFDFHPRIGMMEITQENTRL